MKSLLRHFVLLFILIVAVLASSLILSRGMCSKMGLLLLPASVNKIVLGDSQAQCAFNDKDPTVKNMAKAADSYFYSYIKLRELKKFNPRIDTVFLSLSTINITGFIEERWISSTAHIQSRFSKYCCLFNKEDFMFLFRLNPTGVLKSFTHIPSTALQLLFHFRHEKDIDLLKLGGFEALTQTQLHEAIIKHQEEHEQIEHSLSEVETTYLDKITQFCDSNQVTLLFFNAPVHHEYLSSISEQEKLLFQKYFSSSSLSSVPYLNYSAYHFPDSCFSDLVHLNSVGANLFTNILMDGSHP